MYFLYSILLTIGFLLMLPAFVFRRQKYAAGLSERLGNYPEFKHDGRKVIWLHCVSVGETNAARPLVDALKKEFPNHRLVVSTTTRTGQELARNIFKEKADAVFYFPIDWKFAVRRALANFKPSVVLLMETEIWPRFIREAKQSGAKIAIVNGRLSAKSFSRYSMVRRFIKSVLDNIDLALMQGSNDKQHIEKLGLDPRKIRQTGNIKFDHAIDESGSDLAAEFAQRFRITRDHPLIVAASTHEPEERLVLEALCSVANGATKQRPRLLIVPRHPERFDAVAKMIDAFRSDPACEWPRYTFVRRSEPPSESDNNADVILLDTIGELRALYPLAEIVFVGGSLIPHGGQSVLEPAAAGKAIVTGPHTHNFTEVVNAFRGQNALIQLPAERSSEQTVDDLFMTFCELLDDPDRRNQMARAAAAVMNANRGATQTTINELRTTIIP
jgi:3-deoxy-D-manno-octulosonic-acid transferase